MLDILFLMTLLYAVMAVNGYVSGWMVLTFFLFPTITFAGFVIYKSLRKNLKSND